MRSAHSVIVDGEHPVASGTREGAPVAQPGAAALATGNRLRRAAGAMRRVLETSYRDPLFERPDLIENDYYRFRNQPSGW